MRKARILMFDRTAGMLEERDDGYVFQYIPSYLESSDSVAVSLSLPVRKEPYFDKRLFPFFDGLIPEGWMLHIAERTWKLNQRDRMGLLLACCRDCIGAVSVVPMNEDA